MARLIHSVAGLLLLAVVGRSLAQDEAQDPLQNEELTLPPVIEAVPGETNFEPPPEDRDDVLEAVITGGQTPWRLPDLGSSLRNREEEIDETQRIHVRFIPLYDPEEEDPAIAIFPDIEDQRDVGFLRIFEIGIGRRSARDSDDPSDVEPNSEPDGESGD
jgi:hypothetical protein